MPKRFVVPVEIEEFDDGSGYLAICPAIQGCHAEGATVPEALDILEDVARTLLEMQVEDGLGLPEDLLRRGPLKFHAEIPVTLG